MLVRVLLVADTHIGLDLPVRPRVERRRRGPDFLANFERALEPALRGEVDLVVHGGDLLDRGRVPEAIVELAMGPLLQVARAGVPVYLVPGNHERSRIPLRLWTVHPNLHIFHEASTFLCPVHDVRVALAGFPCARRTARDSFSGLVESTGYRRVEADIKLLCLHQAVEGSQVGVQNYTFRGGADVVRGREIPAAFAAVLAGHIHRYQVLTRDLAGRKLGAPVVYPGSVERTAFMEREEEKGYVRADLERADGKGRLSQVSFVPLPARPMALLELRPDRAKAEALAKHLRDQLEKLDAQSVVSIRVLGDWTPAVVQALSATSMRAIVPSSMSVTVSYPRAGAGLWPTQQHGGMGPAARVQDEDEV